MSNTAQGTTVPFDEKLLDMLRDAAQACNRHCPDDDNPASICLTVLTGVRNGLTEVERLTESHKRLHAMMPLFQEARDALPAIPLTAAKLRGLDLTLADRMDDVGMPERWKARKERGG